MIAGCGGIEVSVPEVWQEIQLEPGVEFAVPPEAVRAGEVSVDSSAGYFDGPGYRITFDLGRFGEQLDDYEREKDFVQVATRLGGRPAVEVAFVPGDEEFGWARIAQVDMEDDRTLTLRVSCESREQCAFAQLVFDSVRIA
jgi:hypothetical protein